jgi:type I restriction enzyme M protein
VESDSDLCERCGAEGLAVAYGMPTPETINEVEANRVVLGGCAVEPGLPTMRCPACGHSWGRLRFPTSQSAESVFDEDEPDSVLPDGHCLRGQAALLTGIDADTLKRWHRRSLFVQTERFIREHDGDPTNIHVYGQESIEETWRLAKMNLAIHGIDNKGLGARWGDTFARDQHADVQMDYVLANPPFNIKDWSRNVEDSRWKYGVPPANNANYAWIQHILSKLAPGGQAGVVMANGSMSSNSNGEGQIRAQIVEADLVSCMVALPTQLFRSTGIPVCLWFFAKDKGKRSGEVLFIDARNMGSMVDRAERALADEDVVRIGDTFHAWIGSESAARKGLVYADEPGHCRSVGLAEIKVNEYSLAPGPYVGAVDDEVDDELVEARIERLTAELLAALETSGRCEAEVRAMLRVLR